MALGWTGNDDMRWIIRHLIQKKKENETASATAGAAGVFATRPLDTCGRVRGCLFGVSMCLRRRWMTVLS